MSETGQMSVHGGAPDEVLLQCWRESSMMSVPGHKIILSLGSHHCLGVHS